MLSIFGGLALRERSGRLVLTLPAAHRIAFGILSAFSLFILCFGVLFEGEPTLLLPQNAGAGLLALVMLLGLVYEDRWTFDRAAGHLENRSGLVFLARRTRLPMADLERISIERFTRGRLSEEPARAGNETTAAASPLGDGLRRRFGGRQRIVRLLAVDRDGAVHVLDMSPAQRLAQFRSRGLRIAGYCGVRFEDATTD